MQTRSGEWSHHSTRRRSALQAGKPRVPNEKWWEYDGQPLSFPLVPGHGCGDLNCRAEAMKVGDSPSCEAACRNRKRLTVTGGPGAQGSRLRVFGGGLGGRPY